MSPAVAVPVTIDLTAKVAPFHIAVTLGSLFSGIEETGVVVVDTITAFNYTVSNGAVASVQTQDGFGSATLLLTGANGICDINGTFITQSGASGAGQASITVIGGTPPVVSPPPIQAESVHLNISLTP
jgi:hypothetical protein